MLKSIGVVTTSRADYGIYLPILKALQEHEFFELKLYVTGMHLSEMYGRTIEAIRHDGFPLTRVVDVLLGHDSAESVAKSMGLCIMSFAQVFAQERPDLLLVLGDRFEMFAVASAAVPFNIPLGHIHGGETTQGAIDDVFRHALTKLSHVHFTSTPHYSKCVEAMGEESWRVHTVGAPALDNVLGLDVASRQELEVCLDIDLSGPTLIMTYHPETRDPGCVQHAIDAVIASLYEWPGVVIMTDVNADTQGGTVRQALHEFARTRPDRVRLVKSLGVRRYFGVLQLATAMIGNSSSGIIEAASFGLPVINIGERQRGRIAGLNVIHVGHDIQEIKSALDQATSDEFRQGCRRMANPYGDGRAAQKIIKILEELPQGDALLLKRPPKN